jgi:hypothetical protein
MSKFTDTDKRSDSEKEAEKEIQKVMLDSMTEISKEKDFENFVPNIKNGEIVGYFVKRKGMKLINEK